MNVSVVIPTYNGESKISLLLDALLRQSVVDFELVVVIDGSTDKTAKVIEGYQARFRKLVVIEQENKGRAAVRNNGAKNATGDLLIFFDDDVAPMGNSIEKHLDFHSKNAKESILCGNPLELPSESKTDIQNYKAFQTEKWTRHFGYGLNEIKEGGVFLTAANMSIPKSLFNKLKGFDERLTDIEDLEFAKRAIGTNVPIYFDKTNLSVHNDPISCVSYINRIRQYNRAQRLLHGLFPDQFEDRKVRNPYKRAFYWMFASPFWPRLIDQGWLTFLPRFVRFKVYDWVIHSLGVVFTDRNVDSSKSAVS